MENIVITEEQFEERFVMIKNHFYENPDDCSFNGCLFETYGEEREYVNEAVLNSMKKRHLWTIVEGDDDTKLYYQSGYHIVNRIGFFFTEEEVVEDHLTVVIDITPFDKQECIDGGNHLQSCDDDGFCNECGHQ